jgi:hypothetical protein
MKTPQTGDAKQLREELERDVLGRRREFLKRVLLTSAYVTPIVMSFAARDLARAASCPGVGNCGKSAWAHGM